MGQDDDNDCMHVWQLTEVGGVRGQLDMASTCLVCGGVKYDPSPNALRDRRPPL